MIPPPPIQFPAGREHYIGVIPGALPVGLCSEVYEFASSAIPTIGTPGQTVAGLQPSIKKSEDLRFEGWDKWPERWRTEFDPQRLDAEIANRVGFGLRIYCKSYDWLTSIGDWNDTGYQMQKYPQGSGRYIEHVDSSPTYNQDRVLAVIFYLNDVEVGGGTKFSMQGITTQARAGDMVVFPAKWTHPHSGEVPVSGDKFIISTFIHHASRPQQ